MSKDAGAATAAVAQAAAVAQSVYSHSRATVKSSAQAAGASVAGHQARPAGPGPAPIVVQLTGMPAAHVTGPGGPAS